MSPFRYRILVVDDDVMIAEMAKVVLESQGYEVHCAMDGFGGLTALKQSPPDVIISDLQMPNMSGFEFLSIVRKRFPNIPTIAISGAFSGRGVPESVLADAFFEKGQYSMEELFQKIIALLEEFAARPRREHRAEQAPSRASHLDSGQQRKLHRGHVFFLPKNIPGSRPTPDWCPQSRVRCLRAGCLIPYHRWV
jgi:CheY-like chemotaxis protein